MIFRGFYVVFLLNLIFHTCISEQDFLEFASYTKGNSLIYSVTIADSVEVDAYRSNQILVQNFRNYLTNVNPVLLFHCRVKPLTNDSLIDTAELCYKPSIKSNEVCYNVMNTGILELGPDLSIQIQKNSSTGFSADFRIKSSLRSNDGLYYCKLSNKHHTITSNFIELENTAYQFIRQLEGLSPVKDSQSVKVVNTSPISLHCGRNIYPESKKSSTFKKSPFHWSLWTKSQYGQISLLAVNSLMEFVQHQNGTLEIFKFYKNLDSIILLCKSYLDESYYSIYNLEIDITDQPTHYSSPIQIVSPKGNRITLREGPTNVQNEILSAIYYSNPANLMTRATWKKNNVPINHVYPDALSNKYNFMFPNDIDKKFAGQYSLLVEQIEPRDSTEFLFDVDVIGVPKFKGSPSRTIYKMAGQSAVLLAEMSGNPKLMEIHIDNLAVPVTATGKEIIGSIKNIDSDNAELRLEIPHVTTNLTRPKSFLNSDSEKLPDSRFSRTYTVAFIGSTNVTSSRVDSILKVFNIPLVSPHAKPSDCPLAGNFNISYVTNADDYAKEGLELNHMWSAINAEGNEVDIRKFVTIHNETIFLNGTTTKNLMGLRFQYRLQMFEPRQPNMVKVLLFDSHNDPRLVKTFRTQITCIVKSGLPLVIIAIVVALVVLVILILVIVICLTRHKGETYNIDKNERAMGHDPEAEVRENEIFLNYERQNEDQQNKVDQISLNNDSVGEDSEGGELDDDGGIDTASYSEEGSFINEYSASSRPCEPPQSKTQDSLV